MSHVLPLDARIESNTSFNFAVAKVLAMLLVVTGHFFEGSVLWIPVTVGLFVFAYSSAYFTSRKDSPRISLLQFWKNKAARLAVPFWISQAFLLAVFIVAGGDGIWTWQTAMHWLGQTGWIAWFGLPNPSPFGFGLWFFTLLLLFYVVFPFVSWCQRSSIRAHVALGLVLISMIVLQHSIDVGHMLWATIFAFWFGVYSAHHSPPGSARFWLVMALSCAAILVLTNGAGFKRLNILLLIAISISVVLWLERTRLNRPLLSWSRVLSPCALEIYLIHKYLFVDFGLSLPVRYIVSMIGIVGCAYLLAAITGQFERRNIHARAAHT